MACQLHASIAVKIYNFKVSIFIALLFNFDQIKYKTYKAGYQIMRFAVFSCRQNLHNIFQIGLKQMCSDGTKFALGEKKKIEM